MLYTIVTQVWKALDILLNLLVYALIAYTVLSWIVKPFSPVYRWMNRILAPALNPFRPFAQRLMRSGVMVDLTPMLAVLGVELIRLLLGGIFDLLRNL